MPVPGSDVGPTAGDLPEDPRDDAAVATASQIGEWGQVFPLPNVAVHAHLLPTGKVLLWGRRDSPTGSLDDHFCTPQVWDPATGTAVPTPQPRPFQADGEPLVNLFCSGHTLLADGRVFVAGGHLQDTKGVNQACIYDHEANTWTALPPMIQGRWYPTATTLTDGRVLVLSGSGDVPGKGVVVTNVPQIWDGTRWQSAAAYPDPPPLYPRLHLIADGRLFDTGTNAATPFFDIAANRWDTGLARPDGERQYAPSVLYDPHKIIYIGGGNDPGPDTPTARTSLIDLSGAAPNWQEGPPMAFPRRQHNATLLPDGTVLVTGGTSGRGFNDLSPGKPVHAAELWNPATNAWTPMAAESVDRCYHSTAVLMPDGRVLSAGGGEFAGQTNPADSHRDGQFFHPPYLFRGPRPHIDSLSADTVGNGAAITATVSGPPVAKVTLVRLSSVTHAFNATQRINVLAFTAQAATVTATVPPDPAECLPGHYMLFVLSDTGVPSVARIVRILPATKPGPVELRTDPNHDTAAIAADPERLRTADDGGPSTAELDDTVLERAHRGELGTEVSVGLTAQCPYGLGGCWGGAYEALRQLEGVAAVRPIANAADSTATVYLEHRGLPALERWPQQLAASANASYHYRGVEVSLTGQVTGLENRPQLVVLGSGAVVELAPLEPGSELPWDLDARRPRAASDEERRAFERLLTFLATDPDAQMRITGPLRPTDPHLTVLVRHFAPAMSLAGPPARAR